MKDLTKATVILLVGWALLSGIGVWLTYANP